MSQMISKPELKYVVYSDYNMLMFGNIIMESGNISKLVLRVNSFKRTYSLLLEHVEPEGEYVWESQEYTIDEEVFHIQKPDGLIRLYKANAVNMEEDLNLGLMKVRRKKDGEEYSY